MRGVFVLCASGVIIMIGMGVISPVLPLYGKSFGVSAALIGFLFTSFGLARVLTDLPAGFFYQRLGKRMLVAGPVVVAISGVLCGMAANFWELVIYRFIGGVGSALFTTSALALLAELAEPERRGRVMGLFQGSVLLGMGLGPAVGGLVAQYYGYRVPFFLYSALALISALSALIYIPEVEARRNNRPQALRPFGMRHLIFNPNFLLVVFVTFSIFFTRTGSRMTIVPLLGADRLALGPKEIGLALAITALINLLVLYPSGSLADRFGRKRVIVPSTILMALSLISFALSGSFWLYIVSAILLGIGSGSAGSAPAAYASDLAPPGSYGITMGLYRTIGDVGWMVGAVLMGWLADLGGYTTALSFNALLLILSGMLFGLRAEEKRVAKIAEPPLDVEGPS